MKKTFVIFYLLCLLISACAVEGNTGVTATALASPTTTRRPTFTPRPTSTLWPTQTPTLTFTPTLTSVPTFTSTPQPTLEAHTWTPERILIYVFSSGGDGGYRNVILPPEFVLYSDRHLFLSGLEKQNDVWKRVIRHTQLSRADTCKLLNTIDQNGFFDYDTSTYQPPQHDGGPETHISINAWRKKIGYFYDLAHALVDLDKPWAPRNAPALLNTSNLLFRYEPEGLREHEPDRVAVWVYENIYWKEDYKNLEREWTMTMPRLADVHSLTGSAIDKSNGQYIIYHGDIAKGIYRYVANGDVAGIYTEGGRQYSVFVQILLPHQIPNQIPEIDIHYPKFSDLPDPRPTLTCYPSDGLLPIPTPPPE